jgi:CheY-like chemotaxis protein
MNILVVDDDPVAQRIMKMFVEKSGYTPTIYADGPKGLEAALAPNAPPIILLDWMLPGMDGVTVCRKLREAKPKVRPYIIILSAKHGKEEIAAGLDAGADDFVSKPFNVAEMQARLRVASRLVDYQRELLKQIEDNEVLIQRNSLLGELISKRQGVEAQEQPAPVAKPVVTPKNAEKPPEPKPTDFTDHEVRYMLSIALLELRVALQGVKPRLKAPDFRATECCAWGGLLIPAHDLWLDLALEGSSAAADVLFERSLGRKPQTEVDTTGFMAEMARMIAICFSRTLQVRAGEISQPLMSRAMRLPLTFAPVPIPSVIRSYDLVIENLGFRLMIAVERCAKRQLEPNEVHQLDILAEPFPPKEISSVPILNEGVVLTARFIEKMLANEVAVQQGQCAVVRRPTKLARYFNA